MPTATHSDASNRSTEPSSSIALLEEQAAHWWLRRMEGMDNAAHREFNAWLATDPGHEQAFAEIERTWKVLDDLPKDEIAARRVLARAVTSQAPLAADEVARAIVSQVPGKPGPTVRRHWLKKAVLASFTVATVCAGGWLMVDHLGQPLLAENHATERGEQRHVRLPDGSTIALDASSRVNVRLYRNRREIALQTGQAMFNVAHDASRPFHVDAANTRVTVVGTHFMVRHIGTQVKVVVEEGKVQVEQAGRVGQQDRDRANRILLATGEAVTADASGALGAVTKEVTAIAPWRNGRINFDATRLPEALDEFARYGEMQLTIRDPLVASMQVTGSFDTTGVRSFAEMLPKVLPVRLIARGTRIEIVRQ